MADEAPQVDRVEARAGATPGVARYVLAASLVLIVIVFAAILYYWL